MRIQKRAQNVPVTHSSTMAVLALLEDIANGLIQNERVFRDYYDFLAHDDDWISKSNPLGTLY